MEKKSTLSGMDREAGYRFREYSSFYAIDEDIYFVLVDYKYHFTKKKMIYYITHQVISNMEDYWMENLVRCPACRKCCIGNGDVKCDCGGEMKRLGRDSVVESLILYRPSFIILINRGKKLTIGQMFDRLKKIIGKGEEG